MNELKDTIELMNSSDYKDRFKAENSGIWLSIFVVWKFVRNLRELSFKIFYPRVSIY